MALYDTIKDMALFSHFSENEKKEFAAMKHSILGFNKDEYIIIEGDENTALYVLIKGTVVITKGGSDTPITELAPGTIFGEMSFLSKKPRYSNVIAKETVIVMKMDEFFFKKVKPIIKDKIKDYLIELLISRLDTMNETLSKISTFAQHHRLK